jgi:hypothetical protein
LVTDRSADDACVSVSVALLFAVFESVMPDGAVIVAVFTRFPVADDLIVAVAVYVRLPPLGKSIVPLRLPVPLPAGQFAPPADAHDQETPVIAAGNESAIVAPVTLDGPAFEKTIVYAVDEPGVYVVEPSVFVTDRSAETTLDTTVVAVAVSFEDGMLFGEASVALFVKLPVALDAVATTVMFGVSALDASSPPV